MDDGVTVRAKLGEDEPAIDEAVQAAFGSPGEATRAGDPSLELAIPKLSLVAECNRRFVGHVMVSYAHVAVGGQRRRIAMLSPFAVSPAEQGRASAPC